jgi:capsid portal protein
MSATDFEFEFDQSIQKDQDFINLEPLTLEDVQKTFKSMWIPDVVEIGPQIEREIYLVKVANQDLHTNSERIINKMLKEFPQYTEEFVAKGYNNIFLRGSSDFGCLRYT